MSCAACASSVESIISSQIGVLRVGVNLAGNDVLIEYIDYEAPRVKWGCPESLGNLAKKYPDKVEKAIPKLFGNLKDKSTVVRWCAAFALTEIAKYKSKKQKELVATFQNLIKTEQNNGVKNVYVKAMKEIKKP